jgi:hypothetical protein
MKQETKHVEPKKAKQPYEQPKLETREKLAEVTELSKITAPLTD